MQPVRWLILITLLPVGLFAQTNLVPATIATNVTWSGTNMIRGTVTILSNVTVSILPGTQVLLDSNATLVVRGAVVARGNEGNPIRFTRAAESARWKGIRFLQAQPSRLQNCIFEFANSAGTHLDYYDNDCNDETPAPPRNYHEAIVAIASHVDFEGCLFQNLPSNTGSREGDAIAIISDDPEFPGTASATIKRCRFISIGQGVHTRFSYIVVEDSFFTDHHGDNDDIDMYGESTPPPLIRNNVFLNPEHDDAINPTRCSAVIIGNTLSGGDDHGIVLRDKCRPIVANNFISGFAAGGISVQNQCDALIVNNTIVDCGRGIRLFDHDGRWDAPYCLFPGSGRATVINTIIWDCDESLTLTDSPYSADRGSHVTVINSNIEGGRLFTSVSANSTLTWGEGNRELTPNLTSQFHLPVGSPLIDAGIMTAESAAFLKPLDGNGDGTVFPDIGAHEFLMESADSNKDGIPDLWTAQNGFYPGDTNVAQSNPDGDPVTTLEEWLADTDPRNPSSHLQLQVIANGTEIAFLTSASRVYDVEFATNLLSPWIDLPNSSNVPGTGQNLFVPLQSTNRSGFFRVQAKLPGTP